MKKIQLSSVLALLIIGSLNTGCYSKKEIAVADNVPSLSKIIAEQEGANKVDNSSSPRFISSIIEDISKRTGKKAVVVGENIEISDNINFVNYHDIRDYVSAKELPYKIEIETFPRFDKISIKQQDTAAQKLKEIQVSIAGTTNIYHEIQSIATALAIPLSADVHSISQLSRDGTVAYNGKAFDFLESIADQNNLFFSIKDGKITFRQFDENIFSIAITPLSIEAKSTQDIKNSSGTSATGTNGTSSASSSTLNSSSSSTASQNSTLAKQSVSYEIYKELDQTIKNIIGENAGAYHLNQASGQLFVRTKKDNMRTIKKIVDNFNEIYSKIIEINMTIVEVNLSDKFEAGIDLGLLARNINADLKGAAAVAATGSTLTISGSAFTNGKYQFSSAISALQQFGNTRVTSKTVSTTINSIPTYGISSLEKDYISELSQTQSGSVSNFNTVSTNKSTAVDGLSFHLFPRINPDGKIVLTIQPKISKHLGLEPFSPTAGSYIQNETRNQKEFTSTVILEDGGSAIIAGITSDSQANDKQGLPMFSGADDTIADFIGGTRSNSKSHSEIVVFVTTNISK